MFNRPLAGAVGVGVVAVVVVVGFLLVLVVLVVDTKSNAFFLSYVSVLRGEARQAPSWQLRPTFLFARCTRG